MFVETATNSTYDRLSVDFERKMREQQFNEKYNRNPNARSDIPR
jgi:hypothetical protein